MVVGGEEDEGRHSEVGMHFSVVRKDPDFYLESVTLDSNGN